MSLIRKFAVSTAPIGAYSLNGSLQLDSGDSAYLRNLMNFSDKTKWTFSIWVKRLSINSNHMIFSASLDLDDFTYIKFGSGNKIEVSTSKSGNSAAYVYTNSTFTSTTTWYHIMIAWDLSLTASDRIKIYVNGSLQTLTVSTAASSAGSDHYINSPNYHTIGTRLRSGATDSFLNGRVADANFIDGSIKAVTDFGYDDGGTWKWKAYSGLYGGSNGFRLLFDATTLASQFGDDSSGNNQDFDVFNLALSDESTDKPLS